MKKLDNIVVEKPKNEKEYKKILKIFKKLGYRFENTNCESGYDWFIGIVNNMFDGYRESYVIKKGVKIITLEQLKAMKEDKSEYPKLMWVGDSLGDIELDRTRGLKDSARVVILKDENGYWAKRENATLAQLWKYAQDIEEAPEPKKEVIDIAMNEDILKYAIIKINGKEVEYKK